MTQIDDKALEAAVLAHDKEEAAMRGEPDPWADERPEDEFADRKAAMAEAIRSYLTASDAEREPVGYCSENAIDALLKKVGGAPEFLLPEPSWTHTVPLYATPLPLPDLEAENARLRERLVEALKALDDIIERSNNDPLGTSKVNDMRRIAEDAARRVREGGKVDG